LFWNVWNINQWFPKRHKLVPERLDAIIKEYNPDVIGLNEVSAEKNSEDGMLIQHLRDAGYHVHYAPFGPEQWGDLSSGSVLASRRPVADVRAVPLGPNLVAAIYRREKHHTVKALCGRVPVDGGGHVNIIVSHLAHLVPYNWGVHITHNRALRKLLEEDGLKSRTIMGGDFNEFKFMSDLWHKKAGLHRATGTFLNPTWKVSGKYRILQANYDNIYWTRCGDLELQEFKVLKNWPSDHSPLVARFIVK
jgi:endonuclease/exonuclease/phosphatase family metal-dependent hydrolase